MKNIKKAKTTLKVTETPELQASVARELQQNQKTVDETKAAIENNVIDTDDNTQQNNNNGTKL